MTVTTKTGCSVCTWMYFQHQLYKSKGKATPLTGLGRYRIVRRRDPIFSSLNRLTDGGEVVSFTRRPRFTPQKDSWYSFLLKSESTIGTIVLLEALGNDLPACSVVPEPGICLARKSWLNWVTIAGVPAVNQNNYSQMHEYSFVATTACKEKSSSLKCDCCWSRLKVSFCVYLELGLSIKSCLKLLNNHFASKEAGSFSETSVTRHTKTCCAHQRTDMKNLRGLSTRANYTDRETAAYRRS
jgi:hypothetical protein